MSGEEIESSSSEEEIVNEQALIMRCKKLDVCPNVAPQQIHIYLSCNQIEDISGLMSSTQIQTLDLQENKVSNLTPLSFLINLKTLNLRLNQISNLGPLSKLVQLQTLKLGMNKIDNVDALQDLTKLLHLEVDGNQIRQIMALAGLTLRSLDCSYNKIASLPSSLQSTIQVLHVQNNRIKNIDAVQSLTELVHFNGSNNQIDNIQPLLKCQKLQSCWLDRNKIPQMPDFTGIPFLSDVWLQFGKANQNPFITPGAYESSQSLSMPLVSFDGFSTVSFGDQ